MAWILTNWHINCSYSFNVEHALGRTEHCVGKVKRENTDKGIRIRFSYESIPPEAV